MRKLVLGLGLFFALGCAGIAEQLANLADVEVATGEDAVHPADFPLPPPAEGELVNSMSMSVAGMDTVTVQYQLPEGADHGAILDNYESVITGLGIEAVREASQVAAQMPNGGMLTAQISDGGGEAVLSLVSVKGAE